MKDTGTQRSVDESLEETFPASDAPASHLPDTPPANAAAKWRAAKRAADDPAAHFDGGAIRDALEDRDLVGDEGCGSADDPSG